MENFFSPVRVFGQFLADDSSSSKILEDFKYLFSPDNKNKKISFEVLHYLINSEGTLTFPEKIKVSNKQDEILLDKFRGKTLTAEDYAFQVLIKTGLHNPKFFFDLLKGTSISDWRMRLPKIYEFILSNYSHEELEKFGFERRAESIDLRKELSDFKKSFSKTYLETLETYEKKLSDISDSVANRNNFFYSEINNCKTQLEFYKNHILQIGQAVNQVADAARLVLNSISDKIAAADLDSIIRLNEEMKKNQTSELPLEESEGEPTLEEIIDEIKSEEKKENTEILDENLEEVENPILSVFD